MGFVSSNVPNHLCLSHSRFTYDTVLFHSRKRQSAVLMNARIRSSVPLSEGFENEAGFDTLGSIYLNGGWLGYDD